MRPDDSKVLWLSQTNKNKPEGKLWAYYSLWYSYIVRLRYVERLSIRIVAPMFKRLFPSLI